MRLPHVGFPIGKSSGQCLLGSSPRLIAAGHVLHRLPLPRRPPSALVNPLLHTTGCLLTSPVCQRSSSTICMLENIVVGWGDFKSP